MAAGGIETFVQLWRCDDAPLAAKYATVGVLFAIMKDNSLDEIKDELQVRARVGMFSVVGILGHGGVELDVSTVMKRKSLEGTDDELQVCCAGLCAFVSTL